MTSKDVCEESKLAAIIDIVANTNPKKVAPTSPINNFAFGKLKSRKPREPAAIVYPMIYVKRLPWRKQI